MSDLDKHEQYANLKKNLSNDLGNIFMETFTPVVDAYEKYTIGLHELYPNLNSDMLESLFVEVLDNESSSQQYDIYSTVFDRLKKSGVPYWDTCKPWECEICAEKCEHRMRELVA